MKKVILFDGNCNFCDASVQFIIKRDPRGYFKFASLQSEAGKARLTAHHISPDMNSFVYIDGDTWYTKSTAALKISKQLRGFWPLVYAFIIIPRPIRDFVYNMIASNRYKWFGKKDHCLLPTPDIKRRFL